MRAESRVPLAVIHHSLQTLGMLYKEASVLTPSIVDTRESKTRIEPLKRAGWQVIKLNWGDYQMWDSTGKVVIVEHKTISKLLEDMQSGVLQRQCRAVVDHCMFPILLVEGHWAQVQGSLLGTGVTWEQAWNQLQTIQDMGMRLQLTTSEKHTVERLFELEAYYKKEDHPSASRHLSGNPIIATLCLIPGIGEEKARALENKFGTLGTMAVADQERIMEVCGIGEALAERIHEFFWVKHGEE